MSRNQQTKVRTRPRRGANQIGSTSADGRIGALGASLRIVAMEGRRNCLPRDPFGRATADRHNYDVCANCL